MTLRLSLLALAALLLVTAMASLSSTASVGPPDGITAGAHEGDAHPRPVQAPSL
jgi:hypothetical protein